MALMHRYVMNCQGVKVDQLAAYDRELHVLASSRQQFGTAHGAIAVLRNGLPWHDHGSVCGYELELRMSSCTAATIWNNVWRRCVAMAWSAMASVWSSVRRLSSSFMRLAAQMRQSGTAHGAVAARWLKLLWLVFGSTCSNGLNCRGMSLDQRAASKLRVIDRTEAAI